MPFALLVLSLSLFAPATAVLADCAVDALPAGAIRFEAESRFGKIFVVDMAGIRTLRFGSPCGSEQSTLRLDDATAVPSEYLRIATLALAFGERRERILMVGLGGGVWTNLIARVLPSARVEAVEIDPAVVEVAQRFFGVEPSDRYRIHVADARDFARAGGERFDVVFLDTYTGDGMPEHLTTPEFFAAVGGLLRPGGVAVANFGMDRPEVYLRLAQGLRGALGEAVCVSARSEANLVVFAGPRDVISKREAQERALELDAKLDLPFELAPLAARMRDCP
jgi:spermidine synthase